MSMAVEQGRVIDPILTEIARGYAHPDRVGHVLFPRVEVVQRGGQILQFGKESFRRMNARRAPGSQTQQISFGYEGEPYLLVQDALDVPLPRELIDDAVTVPGVDLGKRATNLAMQSLTLGLEAEQAEIAQNPDNYADGHKRLLAVPEKWDDPNSDPVQVVEEGKEAVRRASGVDPNRLVLSKPVFSALKFHPKIVERFRYTTAESVTAKMLANLLDLEEVAVGKSVAMDANADEEAAFDDVWGNAAILAYVPHDPKGMEEPSFGYTYALKNHPFIERPVWENSNKSWVYGATYERKPVLAGSTAGFLIQAPISGG